MKLTWHYIFIIVISCISLLTVTTFGHPPYFSKKTSGGKQTANQTEIFYVGSYTPHGDGISILSLNTKTGETRILGQLPSTINPSFLAVHPNRKWLFAANENNDGSVSAFKIKDSANIELINTVPTNAKNPCYISLDNTGKYLLVANYHSGSVSSIQVNADGSLGKVVSSIANIPDNGSKAIPHAHSIVPFPSSNLLFSADIGLDKIFGYKIDQRTGILSKVSETQVKAGSGPRHLTFHPKMPWMYLINEKNGAVEFYSLNKASGKLKLLQTSVILHDPASGSLASDLHITPSGMFLYVANRNPQNTITEFSINPKGGKLTMIGEVSSNGKVPRGFAIDPSGSYLIVGNQDSDNLTMFRIANTGQLIKIDPAIMVKTPACIKFMQ